MTQAEAGTLAHEAAVLKALAHPERLRLFEAVTAGEVCVCHLEALLQRPQPYVSKHLAHLREAGLVADRREGQRVYYRLTNPAVATVVMALAAIAGRQLPTEPEAVPGCPCPRCSP
jgi:ArsR family transcriptional regulator